MAENQTYIYSLEISINDIEFFKFPNQLQYADDYDFLVRFEMKPDICLEISEDEHIDSLNCNENAMKKILFPMNCDQLNCDPKASITAYKIHCPNDFIPCGCYNIPKVHCILQDLKKKFDCQKKCNRNAHASTDVIKELVTLKDCDKNNTGSIHYTLSLSCFGPRIENNISTGGSTKKIFNTETDDFGRIKGCTAKTEKAINECLSSCPQDNQPQYDEYMAQINGNSLIVRVTKNNFVTRVFDSSVDENKDHLTIHGCNQQIDFKFPSKYTCRQCKKKFECCKCSGDSDLTDYQRKTSCFGSNYKNSPSLPVIRGNLKYPGKFEDQKIHFDVQDYNKSSDVTEKYQSRAVCQQVSDDNFVHDIDGMPKVSKGIDICKVGCEKDVDVFIWKISQKRKSRNGKNHEIELEMRTPRGPKVEIPKKETREVQVIEEEFEEFKKNSKKDGNATKTGIEGSSTKKPEKPAKSKNPVIASKKGVTLKKPSPPKSDVKKGCCK